MSRSTLPNDTQVSQADCYDTFARESITMGKTSSLERLLRYGQPAVLYTIYEQFYERKMSIELFLLLIHTESNAFVRFFANSLFHTSVQEGRKRVEAIPRFFGWLLQGILPVCDERCSPRAHLRMLAIVRRTARSTISVRLPSHCKCLTPSVTAQAVIASERSVRAKQSSCCGEEIASLRSQ